MISVQVQMAMGFGMEVPHGWLHGLAWRAQVAAVVVTLSLNMPVPPEPEAEPQA